jgi:hypothetical protein
MMPPMKCFQVQALFLPGIGLLSANDEGLAVFRPRAGANGELPFTSKRFPL